MEDVFREIVLYFLDPVSRANVAEVCSWTRSAVRDFVEERFGVIEGKFIALAKYFDPGVCHRICARCGCLAAMSMYPNDEKEPRQFLYAVGRGGIRVLFKAFPNGPGSKESSVLALAALRSHSSSSPIVRELLPTSCAVTNVLSLAIAQQDVEVVQQVPETLLAELNERQCTRLLLDAVAERRAFVVDVVARRLWARFAANCRPLEVALECRNEEVVTYILTHDTVPFAPEEFDDEIFELKNPRKLLLLFCRRHSLLQAGPFLLRTAYGALCVEDGNADFLRYCLSLSLDKEEKATLRSALKNHWPFQGLPKEVDKILERRTVSVLAKELFVQRWGFGALVDVLSFDGWRMIGKAREFLHRLKRYWAR